MDFDSLKEDAQGAQPTGTASPQPNSPTNQAAPAPLMFDDLVEGDNGHAGLKFDDLQDDTEKYGTGSQQFITGLEGAAQGFAGPLATLAETKLLGVDPKDIAGRAAANPWTHGLSEAAGLGAGFLTGSGEAGLIAKGAEHLIPEATTVLGKVGAAALKGAVENGLIQGGDEISKAMIGQGDPEAPVSSALANMGAAALLGGVGGAAFKGTGMAASSGLKALADAKAGTKAASFLNGIGLAAQEAKALKTGVVPEELDNLRRSLGIFTDHGMLDPKVIKAGQEFYQKALPKLIENSADTISGAIGGAAGHAVGGTAGALATYELTKKLVGPYVEKIIGRPITSAAEKYVYPAIMQVLKSGNTTGLLDLMDHATSIGKGVQKINSGIDNLFKTTTQQGVNAYASERDREKLRDYIENGKYNEQLQQQLSQENAAPPVESFSEGGSVTAPQAAQTSMLDSADALATHYPAQNIMMQAAKGRINNYLNSLRPQSNMPMAPFDDPTPNKEKERSYNRALDLANSPLSILNHIKDGTLTPEHVTHFNALYPELYSHLSKKLTEKISQSQLAKQKPTYKVRQGLSLFLGAPMDSSLSPANIQAAQSTFGPQPSQAAPNTPVTKNKRNTSKLNEAAKQYQTPDQAAQARQTAGH